VQISGGQVPPGGFGGGMMAGGGGFGMTSAGGFGMMGGGGGIGMFMRNEEAVKMLELTTEQTEKIQKILEDARTSRPQPIQVVGQPPNPDEMRQRMEEARQRMDATYAKINKEVLKPEQVVKSQELMFQVAGGLDSPFLDVRTLEILVLTDDQKAKVRQILEARDTATREAMQGVDIRGMTPEQRQTFFAAGGERAKKFNDQIKDQLTADQKAKAEKLSAGATEVREKLGIGQPGQGRGQGTAGPGQGRGQGPPPGAPFVPGSNAWRPGQDTPNGGGTNPQRSRFRNETQDQ